MHCAAASGASPRPAKKAAVRRRLKARARGQGCSLRRRPKWCARRCAPQPRDEAPRASVRRRRTAFFVSGPAFCGAFCRNKKRQGSKPKASPSPARRAGQLAATAGGGLLPSFADTSAGCELSAVCHQSAEKFPLPAGAVAPEARAGKGTKPVASIVASLFRAILRISHFQPSIFNFPFFPTDD